MYKCNKEFKYESEYLRHTSRKIPCNKYFYYELNNYFQ